MLPDYTHFFEHREHVRENLCKIIKHQKQLPWALYYPKDMAQGVSCLCFEGETIELPNKQPSIRDQWYVLPGAEYLLPSIPPVFSTQRYSLVPVYHDLGFQDEITEALVRQARALSDLLVKKSHDEQFYRHRLDITYQTISMAWASQLMKIRDTKCQVAGLATGADPDRPDYPQQIAACVDALLDFHLVQMDDGPILIVIDGPDALPISIAQLALNAPGQVFFLRSRSTSCRNITTQNSTRVFLNPLTSQFPLTRICNNQGIIFFLCGGLTHWPGISIWRASAARFLNWPIPLRRQSLNPT